MASPRISLSLFLSLSVLLIQGTLGEIVCENLPKELCTYSIASSGKRCLLENYATKEGNVDYQCRTSEVIVEKMAEWIENDDCVKACGVDRKAVGISSDSLLEPQSTAKICAPACYQNCPNVVDLYFNLAAAEGVFLPDLCEAQRTNPRRGMVELLSSGAADGPVSSEIYADAPVGSSFYASAPIGSSFYADTPSNYADGPVQSDSPAPAYYADAPSYYADAPVQSDSPTPAPAFF
ncbi:hypothetical protein ACHQM5_020019 [Ranunculus cassubicifolius]